MQLPTKPNETIKRLNPHLFPVAGLRSEVTQPNKRCEGEDSGVGKREKGIRYCIALTTFRRRTLDSHDNSRMACKPLVDIITESLGFTSDDCPELTWEYHQVITRGATGTQILISRV